MNANPYGTAGSDHSPDYAIQLARPCVDEPGKYIAESQYPKGFLMDVLCSILQNNVLETKILELKCSERLGVARFELGGNTILLYRNGRIDIRRAADVADARLVMEKIEKMVKDAFTDTVCD
ncbi:MAG: hypothetical protein P1P69_07965 [Methanosarcinaceae archaeon]|nr:hypothetical protein [Methanosarcinaceae archaeon]MDF1534418.1 hypothetical protein [Methanosarcinaceae archaeon]